MIHELKDIMLPSSYQFVTLVLGNHRTS